MVSVHGIHIYAGAMIGCNPSGELARAAMVLLGYMCCAQFLLILFVTGT